VAGVGSTETPSRNDDLTIQTTCGVCGTSFLPSGRRRYCSDACRQTAWRRRHQPATLQPPLPPKGRRRAMTLYQCPSCDSRTLGDQRCVDCNTWMQAVGIGGLCPSCDEPVTVTELTQGGDS
jgi:hypothetical protein